MYGIYANIWGILMGSMLPYYIAYMDPMGILRYLQKMILYNSPRENLRKTVFHFQCANGCEKIRMFLYALELMGATNV